jgi:transposase
VVVLDRLTAHTRDRVRQLVEAKGAHLVYLPRYSPDFNPIENAWSKLKARLRKGWSTHPAQPASSPSLGLAGDHEQRREWLVFTLRLPRSMPLRTALTCQCHSAGLLAASAGRGGGHG